MENKSFTTTIIVTQTPQQAYEAINNVRGWWSENIEGSTDTLDSIFDYHYKDVHLCKIKVIELVPGQRVVWQVLKNQFSFVKDQHEWTGTKIIFDIKPQDGKTAVQFTHDGLTREYECFDICNDAWTHFIRESLYSLITTGKGDPTLRDTEDSFNNGNLEKWKVEA